MKLNDIDFNKLAVFCQVVESGNYQRASEVLNVTPSALSQTIKALEVSLEFALFDRVGKRLVPTPKAISLHREFRAQSSQLLNTLKELSDDKEEVSGLLRIGSYLEFAKSKLTPVLKSYASTFPDVQVKMTFDTPSRLSDLLRQGQLDLAFSIFPAKDVKAISSEPVSLEELVLISGRGLLSDKPSYREVLATPMIEYYFNHTPIKRWLSLHYQKQPKKLPVRFFAATAEMVLSLVKENAGIGIVPAYLVSQSDQRSLRVVRPTLKRLEDHIWLLEKTKVKKVPAVEEFKNMLSQQRV